MVKITKAELLILARSIKPADRKRAQEIYDAWVKAAPKLDERDRLNTVDRIMLRQAFNSKV